ncbi:MAG: peptide ABC transporter substrate-binding protein [Clostridiales bacterium]|jgi:oligopeptide transport system substrate-binding protein|nr:peptide ABC transporter substrate-binding protein [Clostridiales bacterium]
MPFYKKNKFGRLAVVVLLLAILSSTILSGCKKESIAGKSFRFSLSAEPRQIDPQISTDTASVTMVVALFEGLARLDESGKARPGAADWVVSDDGLTYTFTLLDSKWSDGTEVTAHDFVFGMQRAVHPTTQSSLAEQLFEIKYAREINEGRADASFLGVKALDDKRLTITLTQPDRDFPAKTASTPFMPCKKSFFDQTEGKYGLDTEHLISNGPFYLKAWNHNKSLLMGKNEGYHDAENILPSSVRYVIGEVEDPVKALSEGMLDAAPIPAGELEKARNAGIRLHTQKDTLLMLWMNNDNQSLSNPYLRRALRDSIEWKLLLEQLDSTTDIPATGFVSPDATVLSAGRYRDDTNRITPTTRAPQAQQELSKGLQQAGLEGMPTLTLLCSDDEYSTNIARYVVQSWQKNLSLYFSIEPLTLSELTSRVKVGNYQIAISSFTAPGADAKDAMGSFITGAIGNYAHFSDEEYDDKFKSAGNRATQQELKVLEETLWQMCPSVPLSFRLRYTGIPKANSGIVVRSFGGGAFGAPYDFRQAGRKED